MIERFNYRNVVSLRLKRGANLCRNDIAFSIRASSAASAIAAHSARISSPALAHDLEKNFQSAHHHVMGTGQCQHIVEFFPADFCDCSNPVLQPWKEVACSP